MTGIRLDSLGLEARFVNPLVRRGVVTLEQVASMTVERLISYSGVGPATVQVLRHAIEQHGIPHQLPRKRFIKRYD